MERSEQINELAAALAKAQAKIEDAAKNRENPHFRQAYATLGSVWDACKAPLTDNGLSVIQHYLPSEPGTLVLTTMLMHTSGQFVSGTMTMPLAKADPQGFGAASTYARRYGLAAMVGVCPEDDDAQSAVQPPQARQQSHKPPATQNPPQAPKAAENGKEPAPAPESEVSVKDATRQFRAALKAAGFADAAKSMDSVKEWAQVNAPTLFAKKPDPATWSAKAWLTLIEQIPQGDPFAEDDDVVSEALAEQAEIVTSGNAGDRFGDVGSDPFGDDDPATLAEGKAALESKAKKREPKPDGRPAEEPVAASS